MDKALGEFGKNRNSEAVQTIMSALLGSPEPLGFEKLFSLVRRDIDGRDKLPEILNGLEAAGKIKHLKDKKTFIPIQQAPDETARHVNFSLLVESKPS